MQPSPHSEKRTERRYELRLPVRVTSKCEGSLSLDGVSENISAHGILVRMAQKVVDTTPVSLTVTVPSTFNSRHLTAAGTVVRVVQLAPHTYAVAVHCGERPFSMQELSFSSDS